MTEDKKISSIVEEFNSKYAIVFNEEKHEYSVNGIIMPCVSDFINRVVKEIKQKQNPPWFMQRAMDKGTASHKAIELLNSGCLDETTLDPQITGYVESYKKFKIVHYHKSILREFRTFDSERRVCGSIDDIGYIDGVLKTADYKTGKYYDYYKWQLTGYYLMAKTVGLPICGSSVIQLFEDGSEAKEIPINAEDYEQGWKGVCEVFDIYTGRKYAD